MNAGEAYYMAPGHVALGLEPCRTVEFSPTDELRADDGAGRQEHGGDAVMTTETRTTFDIEGFARAFEAWDVPGLLALYAPDVEQVEIDDVTPPSAPRIRQGTEGLEQMYRHCSEAGVKAAITNLVPGQERAACTVTCSFPSGRRVMSNTILELRDGVITRQLDVLARDPK